MLSTFFGKLEPTYKLVPVFLISNGDSNATKRSRRLLSVFGAPFPGFPHLNIFYFCF